MRAPRSLITSAAVMFAILAPTVVHAQPGMGRGRDGAPATPRIGPQGGGAGPRQQMGPGAGMGQRGPLQMRNAAGRGPGNPAARMLQMRTQLELTDEQVKRLEALQGAPAPRNAAPEMLRARADLMEAMQGDGNLTKARAALDRASALRNERMIAAMRQQQEARAVLTAPQKAKLDAMRMSMRAQGGMRQGGPRPGGMRRGE
jgi:Spy/CpxP family protein refolding chaperone